MNPQGQQSSTDHTSNFFWMIVLITIACLGIWFYAREWIVAPIFWLRAQELNLIQWAVSLWSKVATTFGLSAPNTQNITAWQLFVSSTKPTTVEFQDFVKLDTFVGSYIRIPSAIILLSLASYLYFFHRSNLFRSTYDMQILKKTEVQNWPQITPVLPLDLVKEDIDKGPWAMAKSPMLFCREHNMLTVKKGEMDKDVYTIDRSAAQRIFIMQMGQPWRGPDKLPIHMKALLAVFLARSDKDMKSAGDLLKQISASASRNQLDFTGAEALLAKHIHCKAMKWVEKKHAYTYGVMATLLEIARADGVLATAEFLWLKPMDRRLWYVLNNVGRRVAWVEVAGAMAHWLAEIRLGRSLKMPMVKEAVDALQHSIEDILYIPEGQRWRTTNEA